MRSLGAAVVSLSLLGAASASAQASASDELIPRKLVESLFAVSPYGSPGRPEFVVGTLPPTVQSKIVLPPNAKILGGMNTGDMAVGVIVLDGPLTTAADLFTKEILKSGWEVMDQSSRMFFGEDFIDAPTVQRRAVAGAPEIYCGRAGTLTTKYDPEGFAQTRVTITSMGVNRCAQMRDAMLGSRMGMRSEPNRPRLVNPGGARNQQAFCPSYNMGMGGRGTELSSQMTPQDILAHYAKQMADSGWKQNGTGVSASWTKTDTAGVVTEYQVTVRTASENPMCRKVDSELRARSR
jgi:hypothetical protein